MNRVGFCDEFFNKTFDLFAQVQSDPGHVLVDAAQEQMLQAKNPHNAVKILKYVVNELDSPKVKEHAISAQLKTLCTQEESHIATVWNLFIRGGNKGDVPHELLAKLRALRSDPKAKELEGNYFFSGNARLITNLSNARVSAKDWEVEILDGKIGHAVDRLQELKLAWEFHCNSQEKEEPVAPSQIFDSPENLKYVLQTLNVNKLGPLDTPSIIGFSCDFFRDAFSLFEQVQCDHGRVLVNAAKEQIQHATNPYKVRRILKQLINPLDSPEVKEHAISAKLKTLCTQEASSYIAKAWKNYCDRIQRGKGGIPPELLAKLRVICSDPEAKKLDKELKLGEESVYAERCLTKLEVLIIPSLFDRRAEAKEKKDYITQQECDKEIGAALDRVEKLKTSWPLSFISNRISIREPTVVELDSSQIFDTPENFKHVLRTLHERSLQPARFEPCC